MDSGKAHQPFDIAGSHSLRSGHSSRRYETFSCHLPCIWDIRGAGAKVPLCPPEIAENLNSLPDVFLSGLHQLSQPGSHIGDEYTADLLRKVSGRLGYHVHGRIWSGAESGTVGRYPWYGGSRKLHCLSAIYGKRGYFRGNAKRRSAWKWNGDSG